MFFTVRFQQASVFSNRTEVLASQVREEAVPYRLGFEVPWNHISPLPLGVVL